MMSAPSTRRAAMRAAALATLLAAAACSHDPTSAPPSSQPLDVGSLIAQMSPSAASVSAGLAGTSLTVTATPSVPGSASCAYAAASKSFVCPTTTVNGLTYALTYTLLDAAGNPQSQSDAKTTASIRTVSTLEGTTALSGVGGTLTVSQKSDATLSGLLTATHTLNGTSTGTIKLTPNPASGTPTLNSTMTQTISNLVLPSDPSAANAYPKSGTITSDATTSVAGGPSTTARSVMTFNGTSTATLTITVGASTQHCTISLATPGVAPVCTAG